MKNLLSIIVAIAIISTTNSFSSQKIRKGQFPEYIRKDSEPFHPNEDERIQEYLCDDDWETSQKRWLDGSTKPKYEWENFSSHHIHHWAEVAHYISGENTNYQQHKLRSPASVKARAALMFHCVNLDPAKLRTPFSHRENVALVKFLRGIKSPSSQIFWNAARELKKVNGGLMRSADTIKDHYKYHLHKKHFTTPVRTDAKFRGIVVAKLKGETNYDIQLQNNIICDIAEKLHLNKNQARTGLRMFLDSNH